MTHRLAEDIEQLAPDAVTVARKIGGGEGPGAEIGFHVQHARGGIDTDDITVLHPRERTTVRRFGADMDGRRHFTRGTGHAPIGHQGDL